MEQRVTFKATGPLFQPGEIDASFQAAADRFVHEAVALLETEVRALTPVGVFGAQGGLLGTIFGEAREPGTLRVHGVVGHQSVYGDVIEYGRQPGKMPPTGSLIRWIEVKLGTDRHTAERLDFVIRKKIATKGFPGAFMFERAFENSQEPLNRIARDCGLELAFNLGGEA